MLNRLPLGGCRGRREPNVDGFVGDGDASGGREEIPDELLGLARPAQVRCEHRREVGLRVRTDDADHVDDRLESAVVADELAGELGLLDWGMRREPWPEILEAVLPLERIGEVHFGRDVALVGRCEAREVAPRISFGDACEAQGTIEPTASRVRNDRARRIRLDAATVELVDAPALDAVLEAILLAPPMPQISTSCAAGSFELARKFT